VVEVMPFYNVTSGEHLYTDEYAILVQERGAVWVRWYAPNDEDGTYLSGTADDIIREKSTRRRPMKKARIILDVI
jgi:hypothetical protein